MEIKQSKQSVASSIGYFFLACTPLISFILIQIVVAIGGMLLIVAMEIMPIILQQSSVFDIESIMNNVMELYQQHVMEISLAYQVVALFIFSLWYYLYTGRKKLPTPASVMTSQSVLGISIVAIAVEFLISECLNVVEILFPSVMEAYQKLLEETGMGEVSVVVILATILMAPLVEELTFRGITLKLAYNIRHSFWIANIFQALAFGIGHMNLVQGTYAFCLGIVLGCVFKKYQSIYATILFHAVFNFAGTILTGLFSMLPFADNVFVNILVTIFAAFVCFYGYLIIKNDQLPIKEQTNVENE